MNEENKTLKVTNRSDGSVIYTIPEMSVRREFYPKETKNILESELNALVSIPGGRELLYHFLMIESKEDAERIINAFIEPEYWMTEEYIAKWINTCSLDEFKDALDLAPEGTKELIKKYCIEEKINDVSKREALLDQLGFDVTKALELTEDDEEENKEANNGGKKRRVQTPPKYVVVNNGEKENDTVQ